MTSHVQSHQVTPLVSPAAVRSPISVFEFALGSGAVRGANHHGKGSKADHTSPWTKQHEAELKKHSRSKTPVEKVAKAMKRTAGAIRQKAYALGMAIGHRR